MDLQTFVAETLRQIVGGVADAQKSIAALGTNARVNPALVEQSAKVQSGAASPVEFDVAITVVDDHRTERAAGTSTSSGMIAVVHANRDTDEATSEAGQHTTSAVSRVKFTVQVAQPSDVETYSSSFSYASSRSGDRYSGY